MSLMGYTRSRRQTATAPSLVDENGWRGDLSVQLLTTNLNQTAFHRTHSRPLPDEWRSSCVGRKTQFA
jgi:hypothetical protein